MCGIVSIFNQEKTYSKNIRDCINSLIFHDTIRGFDSTGMFYGDKEQTDIYKKPIPGYDFVELPVTKRVLDNYHHTSIIVAHNRAATRGTISTENAHPFSHGGITGVHNGTLKTFRDLSKTLYGVDSEYIFAALAEADGDSSKVIPKLNGDFTLIWKNDKDNTAHLVRNDNRPYNIGKVKDKNILIGASEYDMLMWITGRHGVELEEVYEPEPYVEFIYSLDGDLNSPDTVTHEEYKPVTYSYGNTYGYGNTYTVNKKKEETGGKDIADIYPNGKMVQFKTHSWTPYKDSTAAIGVLRGATATGTTCCVYGCGMLEFELGTEYEGFVQGTINGGLKIGYDSVKKKKSVGTTNKKSNIERIVFECVSCKKEYIKSNIVFVDDAPICKNCVGSYDIDKSSEIIDGGLE